jgi:hypothetical protein
MCLPKRTHPGTERKTRVVTKATTCSVRVFCTCRQESEGRSSVRTFPCLQVNTRPKHNT